MKDEIVSFELAIIAKKHGFKELCMDSYIESTQKLYGGYRC